MRPPNSVDRWRQSVVSTLPQYRPMIRRAQAATHTPAPTAAPGQGFNFFNAAMGGSGAPVQSDGGAAVGKAAITAPLTGAVQGMAASYMGQRATEATASGSAMRAVAAAPMGAFAALDLAYRGFNTAVGGTLSYEASRFDRAMTGLTQTVPGLKDWIPVSGNPYANDADGMTFDDIRKTYEAYWTEGVTAGQTYATVVGRTLLQGQMGEQLDRQIEAESLKGFEDSANERALYAANVGLYTTFDLIDEPQRESAFNQGWGRWISGSVDAGLAWWAGPDVLATRGAMAVASRGKNLFAKSFDAVTDFRLADELFQQNNAYNVARASGLTERQALDQGLQRTAYGQLTESLAKLDAEKIKYHDIAQRSSDPAFVAKVLGDANTPEMVHQRIMAMAGNREAVAALRTESEALADALSSRAMHQQRVTEMLETPVKGSDDIFTRVFYAPTLKKSQEEIARLDGVIADARANNPGLDTLLRGFEKNSDAVMQPMLRELRVGPNRSFEFAQKLEDKALARADRASEANLWTASTFGSLGDGVGRAVRVIHSVGTYARTIRPSGWANFHDMRQTMRELDASLTTNPVLRRLARTKDTSDFAKYGDGSAWMPHVTRRLEMLKVTDPAAYQRLIDEPAAWQEWAQANKAQTAIQFREDISKSLMNADTDIKRFGVISSYEERMFRSMAEFYGHDVEEAMEILSRHHELRNNLVEQIKARGWYENPDGYIDMLPQLQSELASGAPLMDFTFIDRVLRIDGGKWLKDGAYQEMSRATSARGSVAMASARALSKFDSLWRPLVLLRVGYTMRNVTEGYIRELAYFNTLPGVKSAGRRGFSQLTDSERAMLGWAANSRSYGVDALDRLGKRITNSPFKSMKRLRAAHQAEYNALDRLTETLRGTAAARARVEARMARRQAAAARVANTRAAQEVIRSRELGESVVWQQIEDGANLRLEMLKDRVDELIIEPGAVGTPFQWGRFADDPALMPEGFGNDAEEVAAWSLNQGMPTAQDAKWGGADESWMNWLSPEDQQRALALKPSIDNPPVYGTPEVEDLLVQATKNFAASQDGRQGLFLERIGEDQYQIVHNLDDWFQSNVIDDLMFLPQANAPAVKGVRQNVYGGTYDLRAPSLRSSNPLKPRMDYTEHEELFARIYLTNEFDTPLTHYSDVPWQGDNLGGFGRTKDTIGYVSARQTVDLLPPNLQEELRYMRDGLGPRGEAGAADEVTGQMSLFDEDGWTFSPEHIKALQQSIIDGTLDRPVIVKLSRGTFTDNYGTETYQMWLDESSYDIVMAARGLRADNAALPKAIQAYNDTSSALLPTVVVKTKPGELPPQYGYRNFTFSAGASGRFDTMGSGSYSAAPGGLWTDPQLQTIHPEYLFAPESVWNASSFYSGRPVRSDLVNRFPQFGELINEIDNTSAASFGGYKAPILMMFDNARAFAAARVDETVKQQLTLRANWARLPKQFREYIKEEGILMTDEDFLARIDNALPEVGMTQNDLAYGLRKLLDYQGSYSETVNAGFGTNTVREGDSAWKAAKGLDTLLLNSSEVGEEGLRVYSAVGRGQRWSKYYDPLITGGADESVIASYTSTHQGDIAKMGTGRAVGLSAGNSVAFDLRPGTPYGSFERITGSTGETEIILPRGIRIRYKGEERVASVDGTESEDVHVFEAWYDPKDAEVSELIEPSGFNMSSWADRIELGNKISGALSEGGAGTYGGFYEVLFNGTPSGTWYVKEYTDDAQAFAENLADRMYKQIGAATRGDQILLEHEGRLMYGSAKEEPGIRFGDYMATAPFELQQRAADLYFKHFGMDVLLQNWDVPGRPAQGMTNLEVVTYAGDQVPQRVVRADNGSVFMWKGMGGRKFDGDLDAMVTQSFDDMLNGNSGIRTLANTSTMSDDQIFMKYTDSLYTVARNILDLGGPRGFVQKTFEQTKRGSSGRVVDRLDLATDDIDMMGEYLERRLQFLLDDAIDKAAREGFTLSDDLVLVRERFDRVVNGKTKRVDAPMLKAGPADLQAREFDNPLDVFDNDYMQQIALGFGESRGHGKLVVPDPNDFARSKVMVIPSQVQVSNDLIDAARPGFMVDAARDQGTVLDLGKDPYDVLDSLGVAKIADDVRDGKKLTAAQKRDLAIAIQNSGYLTHVVLPDGKILSGSELAGNPTMGAAFGAAVAPDLATQIQARILNGDPHYNRWLHERDELVSAERRITTAVEEQRKVVDKKIADLDARMSERQKNAGQLRRGGQKKEIITPRNAKPFLADGPISKEEQGSLWMEETSSAGRVAADIGGLADASNRGLRRRTDAGSVVTPRSSMYWKELAVYANRRFVNDPVGEAILRGQTDDQIIDMLFSTNRGRAALRDSDDWKLFRGVVSREALADGLKDSMVMQINRRRQVLEDMFPEQSVRDALLEGQITEDFLRVKMGHRNDLKAFDGGSWEYVDGAYRRMIGRAMEVMGTIPEDRMVRHPFFRNRWREEMTRQAEIYAGQGVTEFTPDMIKSMSLAAKKYARQQTIDTLYTVQHVSTPAMAIRFLVPFFPAWASAARFWFKQVPLKHPENLVRYAQATEAPAKAGWVYDESQQEQGTSNPVTAAMKKLTGQQGGMITFQIPAGELKWLNNAIGDGMNTVRIPMGSLDMLLQGDFPLLPDAHPYVSVPVQWFASQRPDIVSELTNSLTVDGLKTSLTFGGYTHEIDIPSLEMGRLLTGKVLSFNDLTNEKTPLGVAREATLPAWLDKVTTAFGGTAGQEFTATAQELLRNRQYNWAISDPETRGPEPTLQDAINDSRDFWMFRGFLNLTLPFAPSFAAEHQFEIDTWHQWEEAGRAAGQTYDEYLNSYLEQYGEEAIVFTKSKSGAAASSMGPNLGEYGVVTEYQDLAGRIAKLGPQNSADFLGILTRPFATDEFDPNVWSWQMNREIPGTIGKVFRGGEVESLEDTIKVEKGWRQYNNVITQIDTLAQQGNFTDEQIEEAKRMAVNDIAAENRQWFEKYNLRNSGRWISSLTAVNTLLQDEKFAKAFKPPAGADYADLNRGQQYYFSLQAFTEAREWAVGELAKRKAEGGSASIDAKSNADLVMAYNMWIADIGAVNMDFRDMHQRYFQSDPLKPFEGVSR